MKRKFAVAAASCLLTLAVGRTAIVQTSGNLTIGGNATVGGSQTNVALPPPTGALSEVVHAQTHFRANVYLHDKPDVPLHERISSAATTNELDGYIPKWPAWYRLGTNSDVPEDWDTASGWFYRPIFGTHFRTYGGSLTIGAYGPFNSFIQSLPHLSLFSAGTLYSTAPHYNMAATNPASGIVLTNSADGDFTITWNGVAKHGWDDIVDGFIPMWPYAYLFATSSIPEVPFPILLAGRYAVALSRGQWGKVLGLTSPESAGIFTPKSYFLLHTKDDAGTATLSANGGVNVLSPKVESTGDVSAASFTLADQTLEGWRGQLQGPNWLTPARFDWEATVATTVTTNIGPETDGHWAVLTRAREVVMEKEYLLDPDIERNQWDSTMETAVDGPATLSAVGDGTYLLEWDEDSAVGDTATVSGQLGDWRDSITVERKEVGNVITQQWFSSFARGGVRERLAEVMDTWTNMSGNIYRFTDFSNGKTSTVATLHLTPNPSFWARNADLSGVSVWNDNGGYYYTQPATLVASNLTYGAAHWSVAVGKTLAWYGKDGQIHSSKIVDQRRMTGDLCLSKISPPLDTNAVSAYPILDPDAISQKIQAADTGVAVQALPPMPVLAMSQAQRGWIMRSGLQSGGVHGIFDADAGEYIRNSRNCAVGGDSGHPVFVSTDATNLVLVGCYWTPNGVSVPGAYKDLVNSAVEAMGADTDAIRWEGWTSWPTYLGPLQM